MAPTMPSHKSGRFLWEMGSNRQIVASCGLRCLDCRTKLRLHGGQAFYYTREYDCFDQQRASKGHDHHELKRNGLRKIVRSIDGLCV